MAEGQNRGAREARTIEVETVELAHREAKRGARREGREMPGPVVAQAHQMTVETHEELVGCDVVIAEDERLGPRKDRLDRGISDREVQDGHCVSRGRPLRILGDREAKRGHFGSQSERVDLARVATLAQEPLEDERLVAHRIARRKGGHDLVNLANLHEVRFADSMAVAM